ncbi:MAG TPA: hypothetical protein VGC87_22180 [Pyrinomonadaceae bacterium]|jgi:hypothetical protein
MNTGIRRFILRLAVGLLAFLAGVGVSWALGGLNPFQSSADSYSRPCPHRHSWSSTSAEKSELGTTSETITVYEGRSCTKKRMVGEVPPPPPAAPAHPGGS